MELLKLTGVGKQYSEGPWVFRDLDFILKEQERVAVVGPSGSGKTTLLQLMAGLDTPNTGSVMYLERDLRTYSHAELDGYHRHEVGIIFQSFHVVPYLSVEDNVLLPYIFAKMQKQSPMKRMEMLLEKVGLAHVRRQKASEVSGGQRQRIAIARALLNKPKVILADEPTGNLDVHTGEQIMELLTEMTREEHASLVLVTHEKPHLAHMDRVVALKDGVLSGV